MRAGGVRPRPRAVETALASGLAVSLDLMLGLPGMTHVELDACAELAPAFGTALTDFLALGLARRQRGRFRCTPRGWLVSNELLATLW
jgi:hypothetical protein